LTISDSESTDTPGRPARRERTTASDAPEFEFLAGAELLCRECRQDPVEHEIRVPGSVAVEEGRGAWSSPRRERQTVLPTVQPPSTIAVQLFFFPRPSKSLISDLILLAHALIVRPHLFVSKNPEKPKKVSVDLTRHIYDGRCKRLVHDAINVLVFVVLDVCTGL